MMLPIFLLLFTIFLSHVLGRGLEIQRRAPLKDLESGTKRTLHRRSRRVAGDALKQPPLAPLQESEHEQSSYLSLSDLNISPKANAKGRPFTKATALKGSSKKISWADTSARSLPLKSAGPPHSERQTSAPDPRDKEDQSSGHLPSTEAHVQDLAKQYGLTRKEVQSLWKMRDAGARENRAKFFHSMPWYQRSSIFRKLSGN